MMNKSILVAVEDYPGGESEVSHHFVHVRNLYYAEHGLNVIVLSFRAKFDYVYDGIRVISFKTFKEMKNDFACLVVHQANLKHHAIFLLKYGRLFSRFVFFFHGHEVLRINSVYPEPYAFKRSSGYIRKLFQDIYDTVKLKFWHYYYPAVVSKSDYVFVSKWMLEQFSKWLKLDLGRLGQQVHVIPNCIAKDFEINKYDNGAEKLYDFVTVRGNLDTSKYAVDLVINSARSNPDARYLIVGKGTIFDYLEMPSNITWFEKTSTHREIIEYLNASRCALMPTRTDAQGLMMCEMASFGIPTITSDIPVCREVLSSFPNVYFVANDKFDMNLQEVLEQLAPLEERNESFFSDRTIGSEVQLIEDCLRK